MSVLLRASHSHPCSTSSPCSRLSLATDLVYFTVLSRLSHLHHGVTTLHLIKIIFLFLLLLTALHKNRVLLALLPSFSLRRPFSAICLFLSLSLTLVATYGFHFSRLLPCTSTVSSRTLDLPRSPPSVTVCLLSCFDGTILVLQSSPCSCFGRLGLYLANHVSSCSASKSWNHIGHTTEPRNSTKLSSYCHS